MPVLAAAAGAAAPPKAELHPEGLLGYPRAGSIHPLATGAANSLFCWKTPAMTSFTMLPLPSQMHTNFHSLPVGKTPGTSNGCSCSLANTLPPTRPAFAPHPSSPLCHSQDLGSEKEE